MQNVEFRNKYNFTNSRVAITLTFFSQLQEKSLKRKETSH